MIDLSNFDLINKWLSVKKYIFMIKADIDYKFEILNYSEIHFDLALVRHLRDDYQMYSYIKDINLLI